MDGWSSVTGATGSLLSPKARAVAAECPSSMSTGGTKQSPQPRVKTRVPPDLFAAGWDRVGGPIATFGDHPKVAANHAGGPIQALVALMAAGRPMMYSANIATASSMRRTYRSPPGALATCWLDRPATTAVHRSKSVSPPIPTPARTDRPLAKTSVAMA